MHFLPTKLLSGHARIQIQGLCVNSLVDTYAMHIQFVMVESVDEPAIKQTLDELTVCY